MEERTPNLESIHTYLGPFLYGACGTIILIFTQWLPFTSSYTLIAFAIIVAGSVSAEISFYPVRSANYRITILVWLIWFLIQTCVRVTTLTEETSLETLSHFLLSFVLMLGLIGCAWSTTLPIIQGSRISLSILYLFTVKMSALVPVQIHTAHVSIFAVSVPTFVYFFLALFSRQYIKEYLQYSSSAQLVIFIMQTTWVLIVPNVWWLMILPVAMMQVVFYRKMMAHGRVIQPRFEPKQESRDEWDVEVQPLQPLNTQSTQIVKPSPQRPNPSVRNTSAIQISGTNRSYNDDLISEARGTVVIGSDRYHREIAADDK